MTRIERLPIILLALSYLASVVHSSDVVECANDFPDAKPWETEADTLWEPWMLEPAAAVDDENAPMQAAAPAAQASKLSAFFSRSSSVNSKPSTPATSCSDRVFLLRSSSAKIPVTEAVPSALTNASAAAAGSFEPDDFGAVFVVGNGDNDGVWLQYHPSCLGTLASVAARALAPRPFSSRRTLYLYSVSGRPIKSAPGVERGLRVLQLLREGEAWQWGGVTAGFQFRAGRAPGTHDYGSSSGSSSGSESGYSSSQTNADPLPSVVLRTLSLEPKVLQVEEVLGAALQSAVIASGQASMMRSPERHYSPGFENYRTSKSAFLTGQHPSHAIVRRAGQVAARLPDLEWTEWPQLLRYDPGDWYKTHRDTFHDYRHPNQAALQAHREASGVFDPQLGPPFDVWIAWLVDRLRSKTESGIAALAAAPTSKLPSQQKQQEKKFTEKVEAVAAAAATLQTSPLDPRKWRRNDSPGGSSDAFELALIKELLQPSSPASHALGKDWHQWLSTNHAAGSTQLLTTLLGGSNDNDTSKSRKKKKKSRQSAPGRPDLAPWVRSAWESAVQAPPELVWPGSSSESTSSTGDEAEAVLDEDVLGPPWVEPNRHCTLMFYLNSPTGGGGETTFPLAKDPLNGGEARLVATPDGSLLGHNNDEGSGNRDAAALAAASKVKHEGMPECSRGLRVKPFSGGGALFYHKFGNGTNDPRSSHGGCPPNPHSDRNTESVAWKINGFMWNTNAARGPSMFQ